MSFPQLFKRSAFAQHDPLITRVYASHRRAMRKGDFGLKFPVYRANKSRFIKIGSLDAGSAVRGEWTSGEKEARLMSQWGDGSVPWITREEKRREFRRPSMHSLTYVEEEAAPAPQALPNVESMSEPEFERYLAHVRSNRGAYLDKAFSAAEDVAAEDKTLTFAAAKGMVQHGAAADFQTDLTAKELAEKGSKRLHGRPHGLGGLAYSSAPAAGALVDRTRVHKGRVLDHAPRNGRIHRALEGTNAEWVVAVGGLTAVGGSGVSRISDRATLSQFDYAREKPERGVADFRINEAILDKPPRTLGLHGKGEGGRRWTETGYSAMRREQPLQTFRFDVKVQEAGEGAAEPGSREWVAREHARPAATGNEGSMGVLGAPRALRSPGAGAAAARRLGARQQSDTIDSLLARIAGKK